MLNRILVIDDDHSVLDAVRDSLSDSDVIVDLADNAETGMRIFKRRPTKYLSVLVDHQFKNRSGEVEELGPIIVRELRKINNDVQIVMLSGDYSATALNSWREAGTDKYLWKPFKKEQLQAFIDMAKENSTSMNDRSCDLDDIFASMREKESLRKLGVVGVSKSMGEAAHRVLQYAASELTVLLLGETGTGKELFAKGIHNNSARKDREFMTVDCTRYKDKTNLFESEMFGYKRGAFTGANTDREGFVEKADGGTLFLDEVHHLNADAQAKLLRLIQNKVIVRVGCNNEKPVNFRLVIATKPIILEMVNRGEFLADLYYRIYDLDVVIPPLKDRKEDIKPLLLYFAKSFEEIPNVVFSKPSFDQLKKYDWPGNVRELQMVVRRSIVNSNGKMVKPKDLPLAITTRDGDIGLNAQTMKFLEKKQKEDKLNLVLRALDSTDNNRQQASNLLEMKRSTFNDFLKKHKIMNLDMREIKKILVMGSFYQ